MYMDEIFDMWSEADEQELADCSKYDDLKTLEQSSIFSMDCDKILETQGTPRHRYRPKYLTVSDLAKQHWCEQQLLYDLSPEVYLIRALPEMKVNLKETPEQSETKEKGSDIHLAREMEIQVPVPVKVESKEDEWAVKLLNLQFAVMAFHKGCKLAREIPVFGMPFGGDIFIFGIIDELQFDLQQYTIAISELKTRKSCHPPKKGQQEKDEFQVGLYAQLFNELVQGKMNKDLMAIHLQLNMETQLSQGLKSHINGLGTNFRSANCSLGSVVDTVLNQVQSMICIKEVKIEYIHQDTKAVISTVDTALDTNYIQKVFTEQQQWWNGQRGTRGVEVEDCWKCHFCKFSELCEWREIMAAKQGR
ncbi:unnamed protein product [Lymnaea stagnalis]|uniref:Exonuclease V n=1 Tax=Lymnaea stagnalis TaxID=6523 RepID=A0AAV2IAM7_LYMST